MRAPLKIDVNSLNRHKVGGRVELFSNVFFIFVQKSDFEGNSVVIFYTTFEETCFLESMVYIGLQREWIICDMVEYNNILFEKKLEGTL